MTPVESLVRLLQPFGQEHLLTFWEELSETQQNRLAAEIRQLPLSTIAELFASQMSPVSDKGQPCNETVSPEQLCPLPTYYLKGCSDKIGGTVAAPVPITAEEAQICGEKHLADGKVAVLVVAGGQGTRLGFDHPKGMFPISPIRKASLFQLHVEKIVATARKHRCRIPFCVMTSSATHAETVKYFADNHNFGLSPDDVLFFCQGTMPTVSATDGKILLAERDGIALSPDGHGGLLAAFGNAHPTMPQSVLATLQERGIETVFYFQVDNPLVHIASAEMIGYHLLSGSEFTSQVVRKQSPDEKVGNIVQVGDKLRVIEYSDISPELANLRNEDDSLTVWAGSIAVHAISLEFLSRMYHDTNSLPFHIARKKVPYVETTGTNTGQCVLPSFPNALKFERFFFDLLPLAARAVVIEVDAAEHFAPLKNAAGSPLDSPEWVQMQLSAFFRTQLLRAGLSVPSDWTVDISPLFANSVAELLEKKTATMLPDGSSFFIDSMGTKGIVLK